MPDITVTVVNDQPVPTIIINDERGGSGKETNYMKVVIDDSNKSGIAANATLSGKTVNYIIMKLGNLFAGDDFTHYPADGHVDFNFDLNPGETILIPYK